MSKLEKKSLTGKLIVLAIFAVAMGYFEAAIVVYLRRLLYPEGFSFPLVPIDTELIIIELLRELATMIMLASVAVIAARKFWELFGVFVFIFGIWDIFYYVWLKATIGWPASLVDLDILFLIPIPWIGPVIAPVLISVLMIEVGFVLIRTYHRGNYFKPPLISWLCGILATGLILFSFMRDVDASLRQQMPQDYLYSLLATGLLLYVIGFVTAYRKSRSTTPTES
ncbi:MAG: hypothetical protein AB1483_12175 [Candidatus Zixiibacteriota bacterium]